APPRPRAAPTCAPASFHVPAFPTGKHPTRIPLTNGRLPPRHLRLDRLAVRRVRPAAARFPRPAAGRLDPAPGRQTLDRPASGRPVRHTPDHRRTRRTRNAHPLHDRQRLRHPVLPRFTTGPRLRHPPRARPVHVAVLRPQVVTPIHSGAMPRKRDEPPGPPTLHAPWRSDYLEDLGATERKSGPPGESSGSFL